jgi:hypothetical protein
MAELSTRKLKRVGSITSNKSGISRASAHKNSSTTKNAYSNKKYVKNIKYSSPNKHSRAQYIQSKLENFKKKSKGSTKSSKKKLGTKKRANKLSTQNAFHQKQQILSDRAYVGAYGEDTGDFVFNVDDGHDHILKKSSTVQDLEVYTGDYNHSSDKQLKSILKRSHNNVSISHPNM